MTLTVTSDVYEVSDLGSTSPVHVAGAINWAVEHNKTSPEKIDVINISFGVENSQADIAAAVEAAVKAGILIVAASGNYGFNKVMFPANMKKVIGVAAITPAGGAYMKSSYGAGVDFAAPGQNVFTTHINNDYRIVEGTSAAAPFVAGMAALAIEAYRKANNGQSPTPKQVKKILVNAAVPAKGAQQIRQGHGFIDASKILSQFSSK